MAENSIDAVSDAVRFNTHVHFSIHTDDRAKHRTNVHSFFNSHRLTRKTSIERTALAAKSRRHTLQEGLRTVCGEESEICEKASDEEKEEKEEENDGAPEI